MKRELAPVLAFVALTVNAQLSDLVIGLNKPGGLVLYEDTLFIGVLDDKKLSAIDITAIAPVPVDVVDSLAGSPLAMLINGNEMYIAENSAGIISKIDLGSDPFRAENMVSGLSSPGGLALHNNNLYYTEFDANRISRIDITDTIPTPEEVVSGLNKPAGLVLHDNDLYIAEFGLNKISKIDITDTSPIPVDVATGIYGPFAMLLYGNDLYITEYGNGYIVKLDISNSDPMRIEVIGGLSNPNGLALDSTDLYIAERGSGKISKFNFNVTGLSEEVHSNLVEIYPNPFTDLTKITFSTTETSPVQLKVYNLKGMLLRVIDYTPGSSGEQSLQWDGTDNARNQLPAGTYLLQLRSAKGTASGQVIRN
jgi:hypothetical protein